MTHTNRKPRYVWLALAAALAAAPAVARDDCEVPIERWQSRDAVRQMAAREGWQLQRLKVDDGCYEIQGKDAQGRSFKAKLDPETLQVVKMKSREHDRSKPDKRDERASDAASGANPVFTPGTAPRAQIE